MSRWLSAEPTLSGRFRVLQWVSKPRACCGRKRTCLSGFNAPHVLAHRTTETRHDSYWHLPVYLFLFLLLNPRGDQPTPLLCHILERAERWFVCSRERERERTMVCIHFADGWMMMRIRQSGDKERKEGFTENTAMRHRRGG